MQIFEELKARGLIAQLTDEEEIRELVNAGKATFYIGFDATADSLHIGHFMALNLMRRLQLAGNRPIALLGGGTTMVGDPSGRTDMRQMLTQEQIQANADKFKVQIRLAPQPQLYRAAARGRRVLLRQQYAPRRVL